MGRKDALDSVRELEEHSGEIEASPRNHLPSFF